MRQRLVASPPTLLEHQGSTKLGHVGEEANENPYATSIQRKMGSAQPLVGESFTDFLTRVGALTGLSEQSALQGIGDVLQMEQILGPKSGATIHLWSRSLESSPKS